MQMSRKKKRALTEFLYILPFLILVALFSYFPIYGWIYAFHDYRPPFPIGADTYVGFKWFATIVDNPVRLSNVLRVLRNTFVMSGISLFFSWFPMVFAVFLNEIKCKPFRKIKYWASYKAKNMTEMKAEWQARFDAEDSVDWMKKNNKIVISPNCVANLITDTGDIELLRTEINKALCQYTWQMFAAESDDEFDALWNKMVGILDGLEYDKLFEYDCQKWQVEVDAKIAAIAE